MSRKADTKQPAAPGAGVRERILDAALALLREDGVSEMSQVQVARRAGVRQSHLTYYFPRRHDLISAIAERIAGEITRGVRHFLSEAGRGDVASVLQQLADTVVDREHMRIFVGTLVEADRDPEVRAILLRETEKLLAALAEALGGENAAERARHVLAALWGFGLYGFLAGAPPAGADAAFLLRLSGGSTAAPPHPP